MESLYHFVSLPHDCSYLPGETWRLEYEIVSAMSAGEYRTRMDENWRRFGHTLFRPRCPECTACRTIRVLVDQFRPNRSQRRCRANNEGNIRLRIGKPSVSQDKLDLYDRYHSFQTDFKHWPDHAPKDAKDYIDSYVNHPFPVQEWCYYIDRKLVGVGYVDDLPGALSAIYFFYDPEERERSLGTWNVLSVIEVAAARGIPYVYLGYFVPGCRSLEYKANFIPNQLRQPDGSWADFRT
jgi:arginyl-tRNA--protein-N-Asp/Glu arginylyltransferase